MVRVSPVASEGTSYHHGSHRDLLWSSVDPSFIPRNVNAIIVPTARRPAYLTEAVALTRALGCTLVTMHSGKWTTATEAAERFGAEVDLIAIDVPGPDRLHLPDWETSRLLAGTVFARRTDLSLKRNLALMLSHMAGWSRILFLDDDITGLNPNDVCQASGLLDAYNYNAVGLQIGGFPDHSVVCHAYRQAGGKQQSFIGGGALAVVLQRSTSFFPDIYNDDWFFLLDGDKWLQPTAVTGQVVQYPYDPFRTPERARAEELGDVLAEGIYWLLDQDRSIADADRGHWGMFLERRARFIEDVLAMVRADEALGPDEKSRRIAALKGALGRLALITPDLCEGYLLAWAADQRQWQRHIGRLPTRQPLPRALAELSRRGCPPLTWQPSRKNGQSAVGARPKPYRPPVPESPERAVIPESPEGRGVVAAGVDSLVPPDPERGESLALEPA
jgi:hypothetical protein